MPQPGFVELEGLVKMFGRHTAVNNLSLAVNEGELITFLGGSGCGKTTTLRMIAGFESPTAGAIRIRGQDVSAVAAAKRGVGMVFQNYALFPTMTAAQNIAFGLRVRGASPAERDKRVREMLALIHMEEFRDRYPHQMSGGQQQRVALARALAIKPGVLLLDEPLSALDARIRLLLRTEIRAIQRALGITTIYVTHDQEEALSLSDRVVVMKDGRIEQVGTPFEIYNRPATAFVASFIGSINMICATVADPGAGELLVDGQTIRISAPIAVPAGTPLRLSLRPELIALQNGTPARNRLEGILSTVVFLGSIVRLVVSTGANEIVVDTFNDPAHPPPVTGARITVAFPAEACVLVGEDSV